MARKPRLEIEGGLYHIITRGVDRRDIFHSHEDRQKFISLLTRQKELLPFYLYAYCLMSNHIHLLIERMTDDIGRIMHRVLTGYTQYYNRRYKRSGHVLQGRHKAILCQSDLYLMKLVSYIHLNPVRAKMVAMPEQYPYSSHGAYIGTEPHGLVDVDPVLRHFGPRRSVARQRYARHVAAAMKLGHLGELYVAKDGVLGSEAFVDEMIHRIGEHERRGTPQPAKIEFDPEVLISAVESVTGVERQDFCGGGKGAAAIAAKEACILSGRRLGASVTELSLLLALDTANVSRRYNSCLRRITGEGSLAETARLIIETYENHKPRESQA